MLWLAIKTLFRERVRLIITLTGVIFSTILTLIQVSTYLGMMGNATAIIRHADADIWIASKNTRSFDFANPFPENRVNAVRSFPDVLWADRIILSWGFLKLANGGLEQVQIVGFNPESGVGAPWSMIRGHYSDVKSGRYMIIDNSEERRIGTIEVGPRWELNERNFKAVGISEGAKSFTTAPVIFMSYEQAQASGGIVGEGQTTFIVANVKDERKIGSTIKNLRALLPHNDIFTESGFVYRTVMYWTVETGIGMAFFLVAILGLTVGGVIVGQTIYANTIEHLREFGTLKALGARNKDIYMIIFSQVAITTVIGFSIGSILVLLLKGGIEKGGVTLYLSPMLFFILFIVVFLTCLFSAYFSVRKIRTLDPMMVFRA